MPNARPVATPNLEWALCLPDTNPDTMSFAINAAHDAMLFVQKSCRITPWTFVGIALVTNNEGLYLRVRWRCTGPRRASMRRRDPHFHDIKPMSNYTDPIVLAYHYLPDAKPVPRVGVEPEPFESPAGPTKPDELIDSLNPILRARLKKAGFETTDSLLAFAADGHALETIKGIGAKTATMLCEKLNIDPNALPPPAPDPKRPTIRKASTTPSDEGAAVEGETCPKAAEIE